MARVMTACLQCGDGYQMSQNRHAHICERCQKGKKRNREREVYAERQRELEDVRAEVLAAGESDEGLEEAVEEIRREQREPTGADRQPVGWLAPYGSNDGRSTYFRDLARELDLLSVRAASHPWWKENPHWCAPLHTDIPEVPVSVACGDEIGTVAGRYRHVRVPEDPCVMCKEAWAAYMREYRSERKAR